VLYKTKSHRALPQGVFSHRSPGERQDDRVTRGNSSDCIAVLDHSLRGWDGCLLSSRQYRIVTVPWAKWWSKWCGKIVLGNGEGYIIPGLCLQDADQELSSHRWGHGLRAAAGEAEPHLVVVELRVDHHAADQGRNILWLRAAVYEFQRTEDAVVVCECSLQVKSKRRQLHALLIDQRIVETPKPLSRRASSTDIALAPSTNADLI